MRDIPRGDLVEVLACEIDRRPSAPVTADLAPHITGFSREPTALTVSFAPEAREMLQAFAEAERQCCAGIGWTVIERPELRLRIEAGAEALAALAMLFEEDIDNGR